MSRFLMNLFGRPYGFLGNIGGRIMAATNKEIYQRNNYKKCMNSVEITEKK
jgi:hypothetical protein